MKPKTHDRVYELFLAVCDLTPEARERALTEACAENADLRGAVEDLLAVDTPADDNLDDDRIEAGTHLAHTPAPTTPTASGSIGPFKIIRPIGEGGMGVVYEAQQDAPNRRVAVKIIRAGGSSETAVSRFRREAELLGMLQHPGIAQIIESGTHAGRPYIAMEFVDGPNLKNYADRGGLGTRARLELVARVADAVHHAHQKGIIHRDLKPDNILVPTDPTTRTGQADPRAEFIGIGQPKVLDFGIARAADGIAGITASHTLQGQLVGTLAYMSPEQIAGDADIDTRSDIYALGVIAFELLSGMLPLKNQSATLAEALLRQTSESPMPLGAASKELRGDTETIVAKAMQPDRAGRYQSAAELATDIRRFLACKPIEARPPSRAYQFSRFCRRNRGLVAAATLAIAAVLAGSTLTGLSAARSNRLLKRQDALLYTAMLETASRAIAEADVDLARTKLAQAPESLRGWEWDHLSSRTNTAIRSASLGPDIEVAYRANIHWTDDGARFLLPVRVQESLMIFRINAQTLTIEDRIHAYDIDSAEDGDLMQAIIDPSGEWLLSSPATPRGSKDRIFNIGTGAFVSQTEPDTPIDTPERGYSVNFDFGIVRLIKRTSNFLPTEAATEHPTLGRIAAILDPMSSEPALLLVSAPDGDVIRRIPLKFRTHSRCAFPLGGSVVVVAEENGHIEAFDVLTGEPAPWETQRPVESTLSHVTVTTDGTTVVMGTSKGRLLWFDAATGALRSSVQHTVAIIRAASHRPGTGELVAVSKSGDISVWSARNGDPAIMRGHEHWIESLTATSDGRTLISGDWDGSIRFWDSLSGEQLREIRIPPTGGQYTTINDLDLSPDGTRLAVVWSGGWSLPHHVEIRDTRSGAVPERIMTVDRSPTYARFSPSGTLFVSSFRPTTGPLNEEARYIPNATSPVVFSPVDAGMAAVATSNNPSYAIRLFDPRTMRTIRDIGINRLQFRNLAFSPDGARLLCAETSRFAHVFSVEDGTKLATLSAHTDLILDVAWSPDGSRIATASKDNTIAIWDAKTYAKLVSLYAHQSYVSEIVWPTNETLLSGSGDRTIRKWSTESQSSAGKNQGQPSPAIP